MEKGSIFLETQYQLILLILYVSNPWNVPKNRKGKKKKKNVEYGREGKCMILFINQLQLPLQRKNIVVMNLSTILTMYLINIKNESVIICNNEGESIEYVRCERCPEVFPHFKFVLYHSTPIKTSWRSSRVLACNGAKTLDTAWNYNKHR